MQSKHNVLEKLVKRYDPKQVGLSISLLTMQVTYVAKTFRTAVLPKRVKWNSVVICAMGGSALGADLLRYAYESYLKVRVTIVQGYQVPAFADANTLIVLCSYSGTTEEIQSCLADVRKRKLTGFVIATGGKLMRDAVKYRMPRYQFTEELNPSRQPRIGTGYTLTALYLLLKKMGAFSAGAPDLVRAAHQTRSEHTRAWAEAQKLVGHSCIIVAAEHLRGNAHILSNQLNESAKVFAPYFFLSELNHHLLEGLGSLKPARRHWTILFLDSASYEKRMQRRRKVTKHIFEKQGFKTHVISFKGAPVEQCLSMLSFGSWLSYYLGLLSKQNPSSIPWVDYFKQAL